MEGKRYYEPLYKDCQQTTTECSHGMRENLCSSPDWVQNFIPLYMLYLMANEGVVREGFCSGSRLFEKTSNCLWTNRDFTDIC